MQRAFAIALGIFCGLAAFAIVWSVTASKPIAALSWLVSGVWTADTSAIGHGMQRIETRYTWSDSNSFLRFNTHFVFDKGATHTYDGNLFWDPNRSLSPSGT